MKPIRFIVSYTIVACAILIFVSCAAKKRILIDGSSTVYPITEAVAEEYGTTARDANVLVGISGTGGGFKKFCSGETHISNASRYIKSSEKEKCAEAGVDYIELAVAYDGLAVVVSKDNSFINSLTVEQLKQIFQYTKPAKSWRDVHGDWPDKPIKVYAPGQDSGTYDYFVEAVIGKKQRVRADAAFSEDDNVLVVGVGGDAYSIGFFGLAYYEENADKLKLVPVVHPETGKPVRPDLETVKSGEYAPLSRPVFIYVSRAALQDPTVKTFVEFYMQHAGELSREVGYVPLGDKLYQENLSKLN